MTAGAESRILLVEDDAVLRRVIAELIELYGYRVDAASDAYRARALLDRRSYDLVISDLQLPGHGLSALDYARRLRPPTPVIVITGLDRPALRRRALACGAREVLEKPIAGSELRASIRRALGDDESLPSPRSAAADASRS